MSSILYYSTHCAHSSELLEMLKKTNLQNELHFVCIDNRIQENDKIYIVLPNGQKLIMPNTITQVPALFLLNTHKVLFGNNIMDHIKPMHQREIEQATQGNMEPITFAFASGGNNVVSDNYSFLNQSPEELLSQGGGGGRQMHNYKNLNAEPTQSTYNLFIQAENNQDQSAKIKGELNTGDLSQARENEINAIRPTKQREGGF
jgi:hypothetical protein